MPNATRLKVARDVAAKLYPLEQCIDSAIVRQAELQIAVIEGRRIARLPLHAGQKGLELAAEAVVNLLAARASVHAAHAELRAVQEAMGIKVLGFGDMGDTPTGYHEPAEAPALTVVRAA